MGLKEILAEIDTEIARLQQARALLAGETKRGPGRPKSVANVEKLAKKKRNLSPEGRKRIVEAVKRRWAAKKKAFGK
jgi:hypothetical protein